MKSAELIRHELSAFFNADEVEWKPQATSGDKALAIAYIDARCVAERLDDVMGVDGWQDEYRVLDHGSVECTLRLKILGEWVSKVDVGGESDQKDLGDKRKAAYSDALKRAAVKWGIGRYLYSLPQQWVPYDSQKKRFVNTPTLPAKFLPSGRPAPKAPNPKPSPKPEPKADTDLEGMTSAMYARLLKREDEFFRKGICQKHELVKFINAAAAKAGIEKPLSQWGTDEDGLFIKSKIDEFLATHKKAKAS